MTVPPVRRWDPLVRTTHWGIAAAIVANGMLVREGGTAHLWIGCGVAGLLAARLAWGLIGPAPARFAAFPPSPRAALRHLRDIAGGRVVAHRSHNPLGALMVYALWALLALVVLSGIALRQAELGSVTLLGADPLAALYARGMDGEDLLEELHEAAANGLFLLAALHLAGVAVESLRTGGGIVRAMLPGRGGG